MEQKSLTAAEHLSSSMVLVHLRKFVFLNLLGNILSTIVCLSALFSFGIVCSSFPDPLYFSESEEVLCIYYMTSCVRHRQLSAIKWNKKILLRKLVLEKVTNIRYISRIFMHKVILGE